MLTFSKKDKFFLHLCIPNTNLILRCGRGTYFLHVVENIQPLNLENGQNRTKHNMHFRTVITVYANLFLLVFCSKIFEHTVPYCVHNLFLQRIILFNFSLEKKLGTVCSCFSCEQKVLWFWSLHTQINPTNHKPFNTRATISTATIQKRKRTIIKRQHDKKKDGGKKLLLLSLYQGMCCFLSLFLICCCWCGWSSTSLVIIKP
jgi:hypothetical protein